MIDSSLDVLSNVLASLSITSIYIRTFSYFIPRCRHRKMNTCREVLFAFVWGFLVALLFASFGLFVMLRASGRFKPTNLDLRCDKNRRPSRRCRTRINGRKIMPLERKYLSVSSYIYFPESLPLRFESYIRSPFFLVGVLRTTPQTLASSVQPSFWEDAALHRPEHRNDDASQDELVDALHSLYADEESDLVSPLALLSDRSLL